MNEKIIIPKVKNALNISEVIKFLIKNCTHAKIIKKVATDMKIISTMFTNLNFDITILLTYCGMLNLQGAKRATLRVARNAVALQKAESLCFAHVLIENY